MTPLQGVTRAWLAFLCRSPEAGGLSCTVRDEQGFLWDMGGHVVFSHYQYFDKVRDLAIAASARAAGVGASAGSPLTALRVACGWVGGRCWTWW